MCDHSQGVAAAAAAAVVVVVVVVFPIGTQVGLCAGHAAFCETRTHARARGVRATMQRRNATGTAAVHTWQSTEQ